MLIRFRIILMSLLFPVAVTSWAQDIEISSFDRNITSLIASISPVEDNAGEACAVIRFFTRDNDFVIEPNLGAVKTEKLTGEIRMWVPRGTKRLTVRHSGMMPLVNYEIPIRIESKSTYEAVIEIVRSLELGVKSSRHQDGKTPDIKKNSSVYVGAGYNVTTIAGPSVAVGISFKQHSIEAGFVYGLNKTDALYFYGTDGDVMAAYRYQPMRINMRYGYEVKPTDYLSIIPQLGLAFNMVNGNTVSGISNKNSNYEAAQSMSALVAMRLAVGLSEHFHLHVTPEYDLGIYKNNNSKLIADYDKTFKSWTDGFCLNVGVMVSF